MDVLDKWENEAKLLMEGRAALDDLTFEDQKRILVLISHIRSILRIQILAQKKIAVAETRAKRSNIL